MACTVNNSVHFLQYFWWQDNQLGMWPPHSPDLNPHNICMGHAKLCSNNNRTEDNVHMHSAYGFQFHQQNFDVQWPTCLLHVTHICKPEGTISSTFFQYSKLKANINCNVLNENVWAATYHKLEQQQSLQCLLSCEMHQMQSDLWCNLKYVQYFEIQYCISFVLISEVFYFVLYWTGMWFLSWTFP
jgi:hypothetical protein